MGNFPLPEDASTKVRVSKFYSSGTWIEGRAEEQLTEVSKWEGMREIAAFPDLHPGRYGPVGAAFLADRIYPQLVGPDIGCGMAFFALDLHRRKIKIDKAARRLRVIEDGLDPDEAMEQLKLAGIDAVFSPHGFGTIGGGNHFCEVQCVDEILDPVVAERLGLVAGQLCLLVHSGSRNHGATVFSGIKESWKDGFEAGSEAAQKYLALHNDAVIWARLNRRAVAQTAAHALRADLRPICDTVHNDVVASGELWLHRKGAAAPDGALAPLAGSRESHSFLLVCDGAPREALGAVSHGAGRRYDRASMHGRIPKSKSVISGMLSNSFGGQVICEDKALMIEEAGHAYKDASKVAADLEDFGLARRIVSLAPVITFKTAREQVES